MRIQILILGFKGLNRLTQKRFCLNMILLLKNLFVVQFTFQRPVTIKCQFFTDFNFKSYMNYYK